MIRSRMVYLVPTVLVLILLLYASAPRSQERPELVPLENWKSEGRMVRIYREDKAMVLPQQSSYKMTRGSIYAFDKHVGKTGAGKDFVQVVIDELGQMCVAESAIHNYSAEVLAIPIAFDVRQGDEINVLVYPQYSVKIQLLGLSVKSNLDVTIDAYAENRNGQMINRVTGRKRELEMRGTRGSIAGGYLGTADIYMKVNSPGRLRVKLVLLSLKGAGALAVRDAARLIRSLTVDRPLPKYDELWRVVWIDKYSDSTRRGPSDYVWNMIASLTEFHSLIEGYESTARMKEVQEVAETVRRQKEFINRGDDSVGRDGAPMVLIPAGEFQMGSDDGDSDEKPVHTVYLDAFYMDVYEVTNAQYKKFMDATGHKAPEYWDDSRFNDPKQPVVGVSWYDAKAYADWAGKRLPTEAEWEKAARGGLIGKKYPWGNGIGPNAANYRGVSRDSRDVWKYTAPVGKFPPNDYGLYDMAGNVWEWCADWYDKSYYARSPRRNPTGPNSGSRRVLRGGSWDTSNDYLLRVAGRSYDGPSYPLDYYGFRCVE